MCQMTHVVSFFFLPLTSYFLSFPVLAKLFCRFFLRHEKGRNCVIIKVCSDGFSQYALSGRQTFFALRENFFPRSHFCTRATSTHRRFPV